MRKTVNIGGTDYNMKSSALTQFKYRNKTGRKLMQDINKFTELKDKGTDLLNDIDDILEVALQVAYVMIEEADPKQVNSFNDFLSKADNLFEDEQWINDVIELAVAPISGGNKGNPQPITK